MTSKNVPESVLFDILLKLPVKSLLRFRGVCKEWCSILDSPYFISKQLQYSTQNKVECILVNRFIENKRNVLSLISEESLDIVSPNINVPPVLNNHNHVRLLGPVNGIICLVGARCEEWMSAHEFPHVILFCNPSTREFKALPPYINGNYDLPELFVHVVGIGFGFDEKSNDYKLVRIIHRFYDGDFSAKHLDMKFEIYNLGSDSWRKLEHLSFPNAQFEDMPHAFFNGACHWRMQHFEEVYQDKIMSFRMDTEVFKEVQLSPGVCSASDGKTLNIFVWNNEYLSVVLYEPFKADGYYEMWVMKEYNVKESWTKQFTVGSLPILDLFSPTPMTVGPLPNLKMITPSAVSLGKYNELVLLGFNGEVVFCDLEDTEKIRVLKVYEKNRTITLAFYTETLVSIKKGRWGISY